MTYKKVHLTNLRKHIAAISYNKLHISHFVFVVNNFATDNMDRQKNWYNLNLLTETVCS